MTLNLILPLVFGREKGYLEQAAEAVGGDGFDVIIENASDVNLGTDLTVIGPGARVVVSRQVGLTTSGSKLGGLSSKLGGRRLWATAGTLRSARAT